MQLRLVLATLLVGCALQAADWGPAQFLIGKWKGEGGGGPGQGSGAFSFEPDVQGKVLVRRNFAEYPAQGGRPASRHDDLTVIYREGSQLKAIYFDNEEHTIRYNVDAGAGGVMFLSEGPGPRYRLTYTSTGKDTLKIKFEIAPPGKDFTTYIDASARREP